MSEGWMEEADETKIENVLRAVAAFHEIHGDTLMTIDHLMTHLNSRHHSIHLKGLLEIM